MPYESPFKARIIWKHFNLVSFSSQITGKTLWSLTDPSRKPGWATYDFLLDGFLNQKVKIGVFPYTVGIVIIGNCISKSA